MKQSQTNRALQSALKCFQRAHWTPPPTPRWDVTDFGLRRFEPFGLALVRVTPMHRRRKKKEDINYAP